jgi:hypothetical protein
MALHTVPKLDPHCITSAMGQIELANDCLDVLPDFGQVLRREHYEFILAVPHTDPAASARLSTPIDNKTFESRDRSIGTPSLNQLEGRR